MEYDYITFPVTTCVSVSACGGQRLTSVAFKSLCACLCLCLFLCLFEYMPCVQCSQRLEGTVRFSSRSFALFVNSEMLCKYAFVFKPQARAFSWAVVCPQLLTVTFLGVVFSNWERGVV